MKYLNEFLQRKRPAKKPTPRWSDETKGNLLLVAIIGVPLLAFGIWFWFRGDANATLRATWPKIEFVDGMRVRTIDGKRFVETEDGLGGVRLTPLD